MTGDGMLVIGLVASNVLNVIVITWALRQQTINRDLRAHIFERGRWNWLQVKQWRNNNGRRQSL